MPPWVNTRCGCMPRRRNAGCLAKKRTVSPLFVNLCPECPPSDRQHNFLAAVMPSGYMEQGMPITCRYASVRRPVSSEICRQNPSGFSWIGSSSETSRRCFSARGNNRKLIFYTFRQSVSLPAMPVPSGCPSHWFYSLVNIVSSVRRAARATRSGSC